MSEEVRDPFNGEEAKKLVYNPPEDWKNHPKATLGVKFSNDIFLSEAWLIKMNVDYKPEDLEDNPLVGPCVRIKRNENVV